LLPQLRFFYACKQGVAAGKSRRWYLEIKTMQVNLPVLLINIPHTIGFQPIAPPSTEQSVHVVLLSLLDECAWAAPHALTGLRPVCGRVARRQNFYFRISVVTAVGGFFVRIGGRRQVKPAGEYGRKNGGKPAKIMRRWRR